MKELLLRRKWGFCVYVFASFLFVVDSFLQISVFSLIFNAIEKGDKAYFIQIMILAIGSVFVSGGLFFASRMLRIGYMRETLLDIRKEAFEKVISLSYKNFSKRSKEVYISHLINDINIVEAKFFQSLVSFIFRGGLYACCLITLLFIDRKLALGMFAISLVLLGVSQIFAKKTVTLQEAFSKENEDFTVSMSNTFNGLEILKLNNIEEKFLSKNLVEMRRVERKKFAFNTYSELQRNIIVFLSYIILVVVILYLGIEIEAGLGLGKAMFLFSLANNMAFPLMDVLPLINVMRSSNVIYNKITRSEDIEGNKEDRTQGFDFQQVIEVKELSFDYEGNKILNQVSFTIEKGKKYLIKGASGAGKSTLMKLLSMTYEDYSGSIQVDGIDYKAIDEKSFNEKVAFIYQEVFLFEDTIKNNITLYKEIDEKKVDEAIIHAGLTSFLEEKENGIEEVLLENGKNLSGGQRQRISIARAIAKEAEILFIDEGTSSLNYELGRQIEKDFLALDCSVIAISHRYYEGVTKDYDYVLELRNGRVHTYTGKEYFEEVSVC
ncbi:MAG: ABC transporter ATP-binding protein [Cellulosilyticaceae bacterium]